MPIVGRVTEDEAFVTTGGDEELPDGEGLGGWVVGDEVPVVGECTGFVEVGEFGVAEVVGYVFVTAVVILDVVEEDEFA